MFAPSLWIRRHPIKMAVALLLAGFYWFWLPSPLFTAPCSTILVDADGQLLSAQIAADGQWRFPQSDSVPQKFRYCITTFEDDYFQYHPGFNPVALLKSLKRNVSSGKIKSGGSTITMQLARMMRHAGHRSYYQKLVELLLALRIELSYKKSSILNLYCSHAPFGSNIVGLSAASWRYFGRSPGQLSWAESALLAVLPNSPALIYPGRNQDKLLAKRNRLLRKLRDKKYIDPATYDLSVEEPLPKKPFPIPQSASHLLDRCIREHGSSRLFESTIHKSLQLQVNELLNKQVQTLSGNQVYNACAIVAETETGKVLAYIGNSASSANEHENYVDIIHAPRSTGSILKPFLYAFMLSENKILPGSLLEDIPTQIGSYGPKNFNLTYDGLVPANQAIARSLNVPAVKMLQEYGAAKFHQRLRQLGFTGFTKPSTHYGLSLILGGGEASLWDISAAYASMGRVLLHYSSTRNKYAANSYHSLRYLKAPDQDEKKLLQRSDLLSASSIYYSFSAMTELLRPQDYIGWMQFLSKNRIAWKTGTSFGFRDAWAVGLNAKYTVGVWVGNADGEGRPDLTGTSAAAPLLFAIFNLLPKTGWFPLPSGNMEKITVCRQSGFKASEICDNTVQRYYPEGADKTKPCPFHKLIHLDENAVYRVNSDCYPVDKMKHKAWFVASPMQEYFFKQHSLFYKPLPAYLPECVADINAHQLDIIYPRNGFKIFVPVDQSGTRGRCIFKATHKNIHTTLFWYMDGSYVGATQKFHQLSMVPSRGMHTLQITDELGESVECRFEAITR